MVEESENIIKCYACHKDLNIEIGVKVHKSDECDYCYADLRCCQMCEYYSPSSYNECRETGAERVVEKEKANYCDFFELKGRAINKSKEKQDLDSAANSLFKN